MKRPLTFLLLQASIYASPSFPTTPQAGEEAGIRFGRSVIVLGDQDGDGTPEFAVGAPASSVDGREGAGRVFVFSGRTRRQLDTWTSEESRGLGRWLLRVDDANEDGIPDVLVGSDSGRLEVRCGKTGVVTTRLGFAQGNEARSVWAASLADETTLPGPDMDGDGSGDQLECRARMGISVVARPTAIAGTQGEVGELWRTSWMDCGPQSAVSVDTAWDADGDGVLDLLVGTSHCITFGVPTPPRNGNVRLLSGATGKAIWIMHETERALMEALLEGTAWKHRLLVVSGPGPEVEAQIQALARDLMGVMDRDIIVIDLSGERVRDRIGDLAVRPPSKLLLEHFELKGSTFQMLLVGKDTGVKERYGAVTKPDKIWSVIDAMSMRRREIEERGR